VMPATMARTSFMVEGEFLESDEVESR
jgi:hypothetical protein